MSNYGDQFMKCPNCGERAESDAVDVGVGLYIRGNYSCSGCHWEIDGPDDNPELEIDARENLPLEAYEK